MTDQAVTVYYRPGCPYSAKLRATMVLTRLPHRSVRFADDPEAAATVRARHPEGWEVSPTVVVGGRYLTNPSLREVRAAMRG
ncbi:glutaredoxin [Geodermatophilus bullaregiensis]|uniref:glutaredoxin family protein n=1 Tax=Geodermatophilus bullaregiensis TaxID=1564160 RepID=UPI001959620A|nr:glutaredoxin domain-containing protein [Geodermatophilus bullaregiensis]MBM7807538.1 glutaredoxin [Geodermatophilus bullaregiensis]